MPSPVRRCVLGEEDASGLIGPNRYGTGSVDGSYESKKKVCRKRASTVVDSGGESASNAVRSKYAKLKGCLRISSSISCLRSHPDDDLIILEFPNHSLRHAFAIS